MSDDRLMLFLRAAKAAWDEPETRRTAKLICQHVSDATDWEPVTFPEEVAVIAAASAAMVAALVKSAQDRGEPFTSLEVRGVFCTLFSRAIQNLTADWP